MPKKILVIDDEEILTRTFARLFRKQGYEVTTATSSEEALEHVRKNEFDLILSDIRMPGKNGVETSVDIASLRAAQGKKNIPVIFLTAKDSPDDIMAEKAAGALTHLTKPVNAKTLLSEVKKVFR